MDFFTQRIISATTALGHFAAQLISPASDPSVYIRSLGSAISGTSKAIYLLNPVLGTMGQVVGGVVSSLAGVMQSLDGMVSRYEEYNPLIAQAQARAEIAQVQGDIRRAREAGPDLAKYIQQRSDAQQQIEDQKIKFINRMTPIAIDLLKIGVKLLPVIEIIVNMVTAIANVIPGTASDVKKIRTGMEEDDRPVTDIQAMVEEGFVEPGTERERALEKEGKPFIKVPRV